MWADFLLKEMIPHEARRTRPVAMGDSSRCDVLTLSILNTQTTPNSR